MAVPALPSIDPFENIVNALTMILLTLFMKYGTPLMVVKVTSVIDAYMDAVGCQSLGKLGGRLVGYLSSEDDTDVLGHGLPTCFLE